MSVENFNFNFSDVSHPGGDLPSIGLAMLGWKSLVTLENTLKALQTLPSDLFSDKVVFFQEISKEDQAVAKKFGFRAEGNTKNQGICEGIKQAVSCCQADIVLFLECDCLLIEPEESAVSQIIASAKEIAIGHFPVVRMRHIHEPGDDYDGVRKFSRYWPLSNEKRSFFTCFRWMRRLLRPGKSRRLIGQAVMAWPNAAELFPRWIQRVTPLLYCVNSQVIPWTNQAIMVDKYWFLNTLIPFAEDNPTSRNVNGFPDLEKELNCLWWRHQNLPVGQSIPGLFSHYRLDRPINDEKSIVTSPGV